jgi:hypothetical protein
MRTIIIGAALLTLAACHKQVDWSTDESVRGNDVSITMREGDGRDQVSVKLPVMDANVSVPNLRLGENMDLGDLKLAPATRVRSVDVNDGDRGGTVRIGFFNPKGAPELIAYYRDAVTAAGYVDVQTGTATLTAHKRDGDFAMMVRPEGSGSGGTITLKGRN